jgi:hypothetical protein
MLVTTDFVLRRGQFIIVMLVLMGSIFINPALSSAAAKPGWANLKYAVYFTAPDVQRLLVSPDARQKTLDYFAPVRPQKFYLERGVQSQIDVDTMKKVADAVRAEGIAVSGALVPNKGIGPLCYNNPEDLAALERAARAQAQVFDELIIDDWLFTTCTDANSVRDRGQLSWAEYREKLVAEQAKKHIIDPAREVRPGIRIIVKYPNWYEGHALNGYDVVRQTHQFDAISVGIETRNRATHDQHIPIYSGYVFQKWFGGIEPAKWSSAWLDNYGMQGADNDYVAQVWQAVLARAPEIILWAAGQLYPPIPSSNVYPHFKELLPQFDRLAGLIQGPAKGVPIHLPYGSTGEYNIFGYLGMIGIPLSPVGQFPADGSTSIFSRHSLKEPALADKLVERLRAGHDVFMTWELFQELRQTEIGKMLSLVDSGGTVSSAEFRTRPGWRSSIVTSASPIAFPRVSTTTWPYAREVALVREDYDFGVLMRVSYLKGTLYVLNVPENSYDLLRLPAEALNAIRLPFMRELGVQLVGPGSVSLYPFGDTQYVLYNMSDSAADVWLRFEKDLPSEGWKELMHGNSLKAGKVAGGFQRPSQLQVATSLRPFEIVLIQAPSR